MPKALILLLFFVFASGAWAEPVTPCAPGRGAALQILGSGGPIADDARASSAYVVWVDGKSRVLIDAGAGSFLRFGESGARFAELDFVGLSHFHTDHSADFPALLKSGYFSKRERPLAVAGPGPGGPFPGLEEFLHAMLNGDDGAYGYLSGYLDGSGGLVRLKPTEIDRQEKEPRRVFTSAEGELTVDAIPVPHGIVPALGFRVAIGDQHLVFASDQNGSADSFVEFARGADVLVMHMVIPEDATGSALQLHARPSRIASIAEEAGARTLVISHLMARSLRDLDGNVAVIRDAYTGETIVANDLQCLVLTD